MEENDDEQTIVWGWQSFDQLSHFLLSAELASKSYVRYVTERLEICLMNVRFLKERIYSLRDGAEQLDADEREVVETYTDDIHEFLVCLEEMYEEWRDHADSMQIGLS